MNAILDIITVCIIIFCIALGYKNGFVKTVMNFLSFIIAFWVARMFGGAFSDYIYSNHIQPNFAEKAVSRIEGFFTKNIDLNYIMKTSKPPDSFVEMLKGYGFDLPDVHKWLDEAATKTGEELTKFIADNIVEPVSRSISYFLAFAGIMLAVTILLRIVTIMIDRLVKLPGLNIINRTGGIFLGLLYGITLCYIFVFLTSYVLPYFVAENAINSSAEIINDSIFFKWFYENSPLDHITGLF